MGKKRGVGQYFRDVSLCGKGSEEGEGQHNCRLLQRYFRDVSLPMSSLKYPTVVLAAGGHVGPRFGTPASQTKGDATTQQHNPNCSWIEDEIIK